MTIFFRHDWLPGDRFSPVPRLCDWRQQALPWETPLSVPRPPLVPGRRPAYPPQPDGDPAPPRSPLHDAVRRVPVVSSSPNLSGAVASPQVGRY